MCKALSEGGQRCHSHAVQAFDAAKAVIDRMEKKAEFSGEQREIADEQFIRAGADLAVTAAGRDHLVATFDPSESAGSQMDVMFEQTKRGLALADDYAHMKALGVQPREEKTTAQERIARRAQDAAESLRRKAGYFAAVPATGAGIYGWNSLHMPAPAMYGMGALLVSGAVWDAKARRDRTAPVVKRSVRDEQDHVFAQYAAANRDLNEQAVREIEARLPKVTSDRRALAMASISLRIKARMDPNAYLGHEQDRANSAAA